MTLVHCIQTVATLAESAGGPPRTVVALSEGLVRAGAAVDLVAGDDEPLRPDPALVQAHFVPGPRAFAAAITAAVAGRPDVPAIVHDNGIWLASNRAACGTARRLRIPYVVSPHGMLEPWALDHHAGRKQLAWLAYQRRALAGAAGLLATAEPERASIRARVPAVPIATIANGVDVPDALVEVTPRSTATLLFMSRLHPKKNLPGLLDAWAMLCANPALAHWRLVVAGPDEGGHRAQIEAQAARLGLTGRIDFHGPVAEGDKAAIFAAADLFVLPSFSENFGIVVTEALAHGVPVVATVGAPWAELPAQRCGWWTTPDAPALARTLAAAMHLEPGERRAMGFRGRAWVTREFGWDGIAARTRDFYLWLLHGGARPNNVDV